jgi:hypothetical protein
MSGTVASYLCRREIDEAGNADPSDSAQKAPKV